MIIVNPSDMLNTPSVSIANDNAYGSVASKLYNLSITDTQAVWSNSIPIRTDADENLLSKEEKAIIDGGGSVVGYISAEPIKFNSREYLSAGFVVYEWFTRKLRIRIPRGSIQTITSASVSCTTRDTTFNWGDGALKVQSYYEKIIENKPPQESTFTKLYAYRPVQSIQQSDFKENRTLGILSYNISEDYDNFYIDLEISVYKHRFEETMFRPFFKVISNDVFTINVNLFGTEINVKQDNVNTEYVAYENSKTYSLGASELLQNNAYIDTDLNNILDNVDPSLFAFTSKSIIDTYKNGLQTINIKCKIKEYADVYGDVKVNPYIGQYISNGDFLEVYINKNNKTVPLSRDVYGSPKLFQVFSSELVYNNGKMYVDIDARESSLFNYEETVVSGLYNSQNEQIYDWQTLIDNNIITVADNNISAVDTENLIGKLVISRNITGISDRAFANATKLTGVVLSDNLTSIGQECFIDCDSLQFVYIRNGLTSIGEFPFAGCNRLRNIVVSLENQNYSSFEGVLFNKDKSILMQFPAGLSGEYIIPTGVTTLTGGVFYQSNLRKIVVPSTVESLGVTMFAESKNLKEVVLPDNLTEIGYSTFMECTSLEQIKLPESLTTIGDLAFNFTNLNYITFPPYLASIGFNAFYNNNSTSEVGVSAYDFSRATLIPTLGDYGIHVSRNTKIIVPDNLYASWVSDANWSRYASNIVRASEV